MAFDSNYWLNQQQQVTPNEQIPGSVPYATPNVNLTQPNTGQVGSSVAAMQYNPNFGGTDLSYWNRDFRNLTGGPLQVAMANEAIANKEQEAKIEIEKNEDELDEFDSGEPMTYDNQGNLITQKKLDNQNKLNDENALETGGGEGLLGKYISEKNPELYGKMTDNAGLFQGGVEGRSFGRLKDFFQGKTPGLFGNPKNEDIGSLKLSKEDNRHDGGSTGGSTGGQTKDDEGGLSDEQKIAMGQAFSQMAQGHRGSFGKYGDIF